MTGGCASAPGILVKSLTSFDHGNRVRRVFFPSLNARIGPYQQCVKLLHALGFIESLPTRSCCGPSTSGWFTSRHALAKLRFGPGPK
jgi:hypothetical protein